MKIKASNDSTQYYLDNFNYVIWTILYGKHLFGYTDV